MTPQEPSRSARLDWPDAFRGFVVFFIAVFHTATALVATGIDVRATAGFVDHLQSVGMGLFFAISGMNSRKYIDAPAREFLVFRLGPMIYLLVLWGVISFSLQAALAGEPMPVASYLIGITVTIVLPISHLWFLWSLIVYLVLARVFARRYPRTSLLVALALSIVCTTLDSGFFQRNHLPMVGRIWEARRVLSYPFFFFLGYRHFGRLAALSRLPLLPALIGSFMMGEGLYQLAFTFGRTAVLVPFLYASLLMGLVCSVQVGRLLARLPGVGAFLRWIGRLTLPVYLIHLLIVLPLVTLLVRVDRPLATQHPGWAIAIIAVCSVAGSLALAFSFPRLHLMWLLRPPGLDVSRYDRRART